MLRKLIVGLALAVGLALPLANTAEAAVAEGVIATHIVSELSPVEQAQFIWGGTTTAGMTMVGAVLDSIGAVTPFAAASAGAAA